MFINFLLIKDDINVKFLFLYILFLMYGIVFFMVFIICDKNNLNIKYFNV